jgi:putative peptide zinc metalloprotease protein
MKKLLVALSALLLIAANDNSAVAINTKDNSTVIKISFNIVRLTGDVIDPTNIAFAYASCTSCETVAIAIQAVLISGTDSSVVTPTNEAWAINYGCTNCNTLADAVQFVYTESGPVHFTPQGQREIADIRRQLYALRHSDMNILQIVATVNQLSAELQQVLTTEVVPSGNSSQAPGQTGASPAPGAESSPSPQNSPSPSATESPSPAATPSPSPSP